MGKLTYLNHLKACAEAAKSFTNGLVAKLAQTVTEAMQEMEDVKADKQNTKAITIPTTRLGNRRELGRLSELLRHRCGGNHGERPC